MRGFLLIVAIVIIYIFAQDEAEHVDPYLKMTHDQEVALASKIRSFGFNCPMVYRVEYVRETAYGKETKVTCSNYVYFSVTITPNDSILIKPWN